MADVKKNPIYKRWWFWVIVAAALFALFQLQGGLGDDVDAPLYGPEPEELAE